MSLEVWMAFLQKFYMFQSYYSLFFSYDIKSVYPNIILSGFVYNMWAMNVPNQ